MYETYPQDHNIYFFPIIYYTFNTNQISNTGVGDGDGDGSMCHSFEHIVEHMMGKKKLEINNMLKYHTIEL